MREFFVSNFQFVLQEAAFQAGARTAPESEAMFAAITRELESAIALGEIKAGARGPATLAAPFPADYRRIARQTVVSLRKLYTLESMVLLADGNSSGTPEDLQRMETLTLTASAPPIEMKSIALPAIGADARRILYNVITGYEMVVYAVATITVFLFVVATADRRPDADRVGQAFAGLVLGGSVLAFSMAMAVADVLGFPLLQWTVAYNTLGYGPLSVLSAFGLVLLFARIRTPRRVEHTALVEQQVTAG